MTDREGVNARRGQCFGSDDLDTVGPEGKVGQLTGGREFEGGVSEYIGVGGGWGEGWMGV